MQRIKYLVPALLATVALSGAISPVSAAASPSPTPSPDATHPRVMQQAAGQVATAASGSLQPFTTPAQTPAVGGAGGPLREVFGFALASSLNDSTVGYPSWNFSMLSTVAFFGLHVQDARTLPPDSAWNVWHPTDLTGLLTPP